MPLKEYNLRCKDHTDTLVSVFEDLLKRNTLVDCTLAAEGQYLEAHKVVLSACSSYFELIFSEECEKNPIVILMDVAFQDLKAAVNFMYRGEVNICEDRLNDFLELANSLQIAGLQNFGRTQCSPEKSLTVEIRNPKSTTTEWQQSRKEVDSHSDSTISSSNVPADCEQVKNNENFSNWHSPSSEMFHSSPSLPLSTSFCPRGQDSLRNDSILNKFQMSLIALPQVSSGENEQSDTWRNDSILSKFQRSLIALPQVSSRENEQSDVNPVINTEPVVDTYGQEKSKEADMDLEDDLMIKEEQEVWDEYNVAMSDEQSTNRQDRDFTSQLMKNEADTSENAENIQTENHTLLEGFTSELMKNEEGTSDNAENVQPDNHPPLKDATSNQQDNAQNPSSMLMTDEPSPSSSRSNQEFYGVGGSGPSAGTPDAPTDATSNQQDNALNSSSMLMTNEPSPSSSRSNQEFNCGGGSRPSAGTPDAPTGSEYTVDRGIRCKQQFTQHTTQFYHAKTNSTSSNITSVSAKTLSSLQPKEGLQREAEKHTDFQCQNVSSSSLNLKKHMRFYDKSEDHKCSLCNYATKCSSLMTRHLLTCRQSGGQPYKCSYCPYRAVSKSNFKKHIRIHGEGKLYQCTECDYKEKYLSKLLLHQRKHSNEKPYQCTECDFKAKWLAGLKQHQQMHSDEKPYQCTKCDFKAKRLAGLKQHQEIHSDEKPYQCTECDFKAKRLAGLKQHQQIHSDEKPYQCTECDFKAKQLEDLKKHQQIHSNEKPYQCTKCDFKAKLRWTLITHQMIHTSKKPYQCLECDYKTNRSFSLMRHRRRHSNEKPYQ